jgi:hypothetical protein
MRKREQLLHIIGDSIFAMNVPTCFFEEITLTEEYVEIECKGSFSKVQPFCKDFGG